MSIASRLPSSRPPQKPAAAPRSAGGPVPPRRQGPPPGMPERRRHRRGPLSRLLTAPLPTAKLGAWLAPVRRGASRAAGAVLALLCLAALGWAITDAWQRRLPSFAPRHRAEALCFALASPPRFTPPMTIEPGAALVRGRFNEGTPPVLALREVMHFDDPMTISERTRRVGSYDVATVWLRMPGPQRHLLVVGWMEGSDLAVCSFRFAGETDDLTPEESLWGARLLSRILVPQNFQPGSLPAVRLRGGRDGELPTFGPAPRS